MADSLNPNPEGPFTAPEPTPSAVSGSEQVTLSRLDSQIAWYDHRSRINIAAALGVSIAVLEGVQQLNQYQANWASYRGTAEALKHEKYFYLANAGPYAKTDKPHALLAERTEELISQEISKWFMGQSQSCMNDPLRSLR